MLAIALMLVNNGTMRMRIVLILAVFSVMGLAQSTAPKVACEDKTALDACHSLQDALDDGDASLMDALKRRQHVVVCFRAAEDSFLLLSYDSAASDPPAPGSFDFIPFRNGFAGGESFFAVGHWVAPPKQANQGLQFSGHSLLPGDDGAVTIDNSVISISHSFVEHWTYPATPPVRYKLSIDISSWQFTETFAGLGPETVHRKGEDSGKCIVLKK